MFIFTILKFLNKSVSFVNLNKLIKNVFHYQDYITKPNGLCFKQEVKNIGYKFTKKIYLVQLKTLNDFRN